MTIRRIRPEDWADLAAIFEQEGGTMPSPELATAVVAYDDQGLAGFWTLQPAWHAGPLWIRPNRRGTGLWRRLHELLHRIAPGSYYSFSGMPKMERVFETLGYRPLGYQVWAKDKGN